jgi:hypothetical protein
MSVSFCLALTASADLTASVQFLHIAVIYALNK